MALPSMGSVAQPEPALPITMTTQVSIVESGI